MQLKDLTKPIDQMTDEELMERLRVMRHNRTTVRPAAKAHAKRAAKKGAQTRINKVDKLLEGLSREQVLALLGEMDNGSANG